ncbi:hypothetical protein [Glaciecola sp. SC05]|uniref:hypothetical protein n=1 Tax=Glaciecola sp. SC05 TaxID=1987355 RepID=UPI003527FFCF
MTFAQKVNFLDGYWFSEEYQYGFKIEGAEGIAVVTNSPNYSPGQVMLRFTSNKDGDFVGQQIFTDGNWRNISGKIVNENTIELEGGGYVWKMVRR